MVIGFLEGVNSKVQLSPTLQKAASATKKRDLQHYLEEEKKKNLLSKKITTLPNTNNCTSNLNNSTKSIGGDLYEYKTFNNAYILIEDTEYKYASIFKEYEPDLKSIKYPIFYWNSQPGHCPFVLPSNPLFPINRPLSPSTEQEKKCSLTTTSKLRMTTRQKSKKTINPTAATPTIRKPVYSVTTHKPRPGFCECCWDRYSDLDQHIMEQSHRSYALDTKNYRELDEFLLDNERPLIAPITKSPISPSKSSSIISECCLVSRGYTESKRRRQSIQALFEREASVDSGDAIMSSPSVKRFKKTANNNKKNCEEFKKRLFV